MITSKMKMLKLPSLVVLTLLLCSADGAAGQEAGGNHSPTLAPKERMLMDLLDLAHQIGHRQGAGQIDAEQAEDAMRRNRRMAGEILAMAQKARSKNLEACEARIEGDLRHLEDTMVLHKGCRQKLQQTQITLERLKHSPEAQVRDHRGTVDIWDAGVVDFLDPAVPVRKPGKRGKDEVWNVMSLTNPLQPPTDLPKKGDVRNWFEEYNYVLRVLVQRAWSRNQSDDFFAKENLNCKGNLYCQLNARQQAISLAVSGL